MGVYEYGHDVLFVHQGNVFFGLAECGLFDCSEDIEAGLTLGIMLSVCVLNGIPLSYVTPSLVAVLI